ncbi:tyrosinase [Apiospora hydei]|uniref:Tyrosinase n=1 Tax=Apiospora hydei TaxID=1337664 RepID=A0ABR1UWW1_9PEZI
MKLQTITICGGITAASAMTLPLVDLALDHTVRIYQAAASAPALPLSAFPKFETVKYQDAVQNATSYTKVAAAEVADANAESTSAGGESTSDAANSAGNPQDTTPTSFETEPVPAPVSPENSSDSTVPVAPASAPASADNNNTTSSSVQANQAASCGTLRTRIEWSSYPTADKRAFVDAIACLQSKPASGQFPPATSRYEDFVRLHQAWTPQIHNNDLFLIWHRYFVWAFEQALRTECGFRVNGLPWWDETRDAGRFASAPVFTAEYFGSLPTQNGGRGRVSPMAGYPSKQRFAGLTLHIGPGEGHRAHCLSRAVDETGTAQVNKDYENLCLSYTSFTDFARCWEQGPHGISHNSIGSVMADVRSSPGDPIFWMHHLYIDRVFSAWQDRDASGARKRTVDGCADGNRPCTPLTMQTNIPMGGLLKDVTVGQVMDTMSGAMCYKF